MTLVTKIHQSIQSFISFKNNIATVAAIPPSGPAFGNIFFTAKGNDTIASITCFNKYRYIIDKHYFHLTSITVSNIFFLYFQSNKKIVVKIYFANVRFIE